MTSIKTSLQEIQAELRTLESRYGRAARSVRLLAVTKTKPPEAVRDAFESGQRAFGENHLQDAQTKLDALSDLDIEWHFIGPIQSNKTRSIAARFDWVHSIDRLKVAERLDRQRPLELAPLNVCIQVNTSAEASKAGVRPDQVCELAAGLAALARLKLRGVMGIPQPSDDFLEQRRAFAAVADCQRALLEAGYGVDTLSMGMTNDLEAAIAEGSTMVRIGTAIFGARS